MSTGWAINEMQEFRGGPERVRIHTTTDHPNSSYGLPVWVDDEGRTYGQTVYFPPLGWKVVPDKEK